MSSTTEYTTDYASDESDRVYIQAGTIEEHFVLACRRGDVNTVSSVLLNGHQMSEGVMVVALLEAIAWSHVTVVQKLLDAGVSIRHDQLVAYHRELQTPAINRQPSTDGSYKTRQARKRHLPTRDATLSDESSAGGTTVAAPEDQPKKAGKRQRAPKKKRAPKTTLALVVEKSTAPSPRCEPASPGRDEFISVPPSPELLSSSCPDTPLADVDSDYADYADYDSSDSEGDESGSRLLEAAEAIVANVSTTKAMQAANAVLSKVNAADAVLALSREAVVHAPLPAPSPAAGANDPLAVLSAHARVLTETMLELRATVPSQARELESQRRTLAVLQAASAAVARLVVEESMHGAGTGIQCMP